MPQNLTRKPYKTDLDDQQWELLRPLIVLPEGGRPKTIDLREVINAILYQLKTGCQWDMLPHDFPKKSTVKYYFYYLKRTHQFEKINDILRKKLRIQAGRNEEPSLAIIDSQSVKNARAGSEVGYDTGKKNQGCETPYPR